MKESDFDEESLRRWEKSHNRGKILGGLLIVAAGSFFLARELGAEIPSWLFSWKIILMALSLVMLVKHGFRRPGWLIPLAIAGVFLITDFYPDLVIKPLLWPVLIILVGLFIMFKPRRPDRYERWRNCRRGRYQREHVFDSRAEMNKEDFIESTSVMGGVKKNILSKQFKGGDITNVFGGTELNLMQADFQGTANLELTQVFGGTKLVVPSDWQIQSTIVTVFGSLEDNRPVMPDSGNNSRKVLQLSGTTFFGGIEIQSY